MIILFALIAILALLAVAAQRWGVDSRDNNVDSRSHASYSLR